MFGNVGPGPTEFRPSALAMMVAIEPITCGQMSAFAAASVDLLVAHLCEDQCPSYAEELLAVAPWYTGFDCHLLSSDHSLKQ